MIMNSEIINLIDKTIEYITELFKGNADGHDLDHSIRVYNNAVNISKSYTDADVLIIVLASLLHDADDHKLFDTENNENARRFMKDQNISEEYMNRICDVINSVSFSKNKGVKPNTLEGCIVQDADRLDALGAIGIARTFAYGGRNNRSLVESVKHFHEKLLLLKDQMNTSEAKRIAEERHKFLENYILELYKEMGKNESI